MPLTSANYVPGDAKTSIIEIVSYEHKNPRGTLKNPYFGQELFFNSATELLLAIDEMLNSLNYPQAAMASRRFRAFPVRIDWERRKRREPPLAVFQLNVIFRQNASWQGTLTWVEQSKQISFRSVFEMLKLIDSVMSFGAQAGIQAGSI